MHHLANVTRNRLKNTQSFSVNFFTCGEIPAGAGSCSCPLPLTEMAWNQGHYLVCSSLLCYERDLDSRTLSCTRTSRNTRFSHRKTASPKQRHLAGKRDTVVILVRDFAKMLSCQNKLRTLLQIRHSVSINKAQLPAIRITEQLRAVFK